MNAAQLIITVILVVLVGGGVALVTIANMPEMKNYDEDLAYLKTQLNDLTKKTDANSAAISDVAKQQTTYSATGGLEIKISRLEKRINELENKIDNMPKAAAGTNSPGGVLGRGQEPTGDVGKLLKDLGDDPEKAVREFMKSDVGKGLSNFAKRRVWQGLSRRLNLREDQKESVKQAFDDSFSKLFDMMTDETMNPEEMRKQGELLREDLEATMRELLDDEQFEEFKKWSSQQRPGRMPGMPGPRRRSNGQKEGSTPDGGNR